jgi:RHS repeat-associated protein
VRQGLGGSAACCYDAVGNRVNEIVTGTSNVSRVAAYATTSNRITGMTSNVLGYSPANRLSAASGAWGNASYAYDLVGNRTSEVVTLGATTTTTTATIPSTSNRVSSMTRNGAAFRTYTYDNAGNIITDARGATTLGYTYNKRNRLAAVSASLGTYIYNPFEQMISRVSNAAGAPTTIVHYIYDLDGHLIAEANGSATSNTFTREYIWLPANDNANDTLAEEMGLAANDNRPPDLPFAAINVAATPVINFVHTDHLGRPTRMTSAAKSTVWSAVYKPWGEVQSVTGTAAQNLRFPGQYFLIETGLAYNWHRHYDAATGRYLQPDPLRFVDGPSVYAYAGNSPWMFGDRTGLDIAVASGSATSGNPFGHTGTAITGLGVFSQGTGTQPGSSFTEYLDSQSKYRSTTVYEFKTTPEQDICVANKLRSDSSSPLPSLGLGAACDNCASRAGDALVQCGVISSAIPKFMRCVPGDLRTWLSISSSSSTSIPMGSSTGDRFGSYDPK